MVHSQIAAPSARSSRHHPSLRPPPRRTPARFYVVSSGRAGLACAAAANSCSCSFYSPHKSNMLKRETKCGSIWPGEEAGGSSLGAPKMQISRRHPQKCPGWCQVWQPGGSARGAPAAAEPARPGGFGERPARSPRVLPEFVTGLQSGGLSKLETPPERGQGGSFQRCSPALLWPGKARIDGNRSSFI